MNEKIRKIKHLLVAFRESSYDHFRNHYGYRSAALSFYTLATIIPMLVVIATILSFLPINTEALVLRITELFPKLPLAPNKILDIFSSVLLKQRSWYGILGFMLTYFFASRLFLALYRTLRIVFNEPFKIKHNIIIQFLSIPIIIIGLIIVNVASFVIPIIVSWLHFIPFVFEYMPKIILDAIMNIANIISFFTFFTFLFLMYHFFVFRNTRVISKSLIITLISCFVFTTLRNVFGFFIDMVGRVNPIYGAFSGVFGFIAWIYLSYIVVLIAARALFYLELSYNPVKRKPPENIS